MFQYVYIEKIKTLEIGEVMNKILIIGSGAFASGIYSILSTKKENLIDIYSTNKYQLNNFANGLDSFNFQIPKPNNIYNNIYDIIHNEYKLIILCVPSKHINEIINFIINNYSYKPILINTAKALFNEDYEVLLQNKGIPYCALYGPSFALELCQKQKTICNLITKNINIYNIVNNIFENNWFKLKYFSNIKVAEFFCEIKNICAIGMGLVNRLTNKMNIISIIFLIILKEILKLLSILNINDYYLFEYFALSDIFLTCTSNKSRNYQYGYNLVQDEIEFKPNQTIEGIQNIQKYTGVFLRKENNFLFFKYLILVINKEINPNDFIELIFKEV